PAPHVVLGRDLEEVDPERLAAVDAVEQLVEELPAEAETDALDPAGRRSGPHARRRPGLGRRTGRDDTWPRHRRPARVTRRLAAGSFAAGAGRAGLLRAAAL